MEDKEEINFIYQVPAQITAMHKLGRHQQISIDFTTVMGVLLQPLKTWKHCSLKML